MKSWFAVVLGLLFALPAFGAGTPVSPDPKAVVLAFYKLALQDFKPAEAFARYTAPDFIEHSADTPGGTPQATVVFLQDLIKKSPDPKWEIVRTIAEGDLVFLHVRVTPAPKAPPIAIAEVFRVRGDKIVEHWDVIQHAPEQPVNPRSMF